VSIDGHQVSDFDLKWLRHHIGVVSQEPILFQATIRENILFGRDSATDNEIHDAAKMANAHEFIMNLPDVCPRYSSIIQRCHYLFMSSSSLEEI
jgi:ATP-binding cassette, subfamily B (MDR/TAP), member 1